MNTIDHQAMTEAAIERTAERQMDRFDRKLMSGEYSQAEYDHQVAVLNDWIKQEYENMKRRVRS